MDKKCINCNHYTEKFNTTYCVMKETVVSEIKDDITSCEYFYEKSDTFCENCTRFIKVEGKMICKISNSFQKKPNKNGRCWLHNLDENKKETEKSNSIQRRLAAI